MKPLRFSGKFKAPESPLIKTASSAIKGYSTSPIALNETNDCVVKAMAAATGSSYDDAHEFVTNVFNRKPRKGTYNFVNGMAQLIEKGKVLGKEFVFVGEKRDEYCKYPIPTTYKMERGRYVEKNMTFRHFIKKYSKGTYLLVVRGHAFTVSDGIVIGGLFSDSVAMKRIVKTAWRVV